MDRPNRTDHPGHATAISDLEVEYIRATLAATPRRHEAPPAVNEQGFAVDENGEPIQFILAPPCYFELHYTEVAEFRTEYANDWAWPRLVAAMPALLAAGHEGKYAVVTFDSVTLPEEWTDAVDEVRRQGGAEYARCYRIQERIKFGRTYPRLRRVCRTPVSPLPPVDEVTAERWVGAIRAYRLKNATNQIAAGSTTHNLG